MPTTETELRDHLYFIIGRLEGLAGTVRYDMPDALRAEIKECAERIRALLGETDK